MEPALRHLPLKSAPGGVKLTIDMASAHARMYAHTHTHTHFFSPVDSYLVDPFPKPLSLGDTRPGGLRSEHRTAKRNPYCVFPTFFSS